MGMFDDVLRKNGLRKTVDVKTAKDVAHKSLELLTSIVEKLDSLDNNVDKIEDINDRLTDISKSISEEIMVQYIVLSQIGVDPELFMGLAVRHEAENRVFDPKEFLRAALAIHLGPNRHGALGLTLPRED